MTTTEDPKTQLTPLTDLDEWLQSLTTEQLTMLSLHQDSEDLPVLVLEILRTGPLSPMQVTDSKGQIATQMPPAISQALARIMDGSATKT